MKHYEKAAHRNCHGSNPKAWNADSVMPQNTIAIFKPKPSGVPALVPVGSNQIHLNRLIQSG